MQGLYHQTYNLGPNNLTSHSQIYSRVIILQLSLSPALSLSIYIYAYYIFADSFLCIFMDDGSCVFTMIEARCCAFHALLCKEAHHSYPQNPASKPYDPKPRDLLNPYELQSIVLVSQKGYPMSHP